MSRSFALLLLSALLSACAVLGGPAYTLGTTREAEVLASKGPPAHVVSEADGVRRMFWPTGPYGTSTIMARFDRQQRLLSYEEVLNIEHFSLIQAGMSMDEVLNVLGPSYPAWTTYFKARDELVWEWRYCEIGSAAARFYVLFDGTSRKVRSTMSLGEWQMNGFRTAPACGQTYLNVGAPAAR